MPFRGFYLAEDYHQKNTLRAYPALLAEFKTMYPRLEDFISSTAISRVNGYLGGNGSCDDLRSEIEGFGLSEAGQKSLLEHVCGGTSRMSCPAGKRCS